MVNFSVEYGGYLIVLLIAFMIFMSNFVNFKSRKIRNNGLLHKLHLLSENKYFKFLLYKKGSKGYIKVDKLLKNAGVRKITVGQYQTIQWLLPIFMFIFLFLIRYTNIVNTMINIETLNKIAEITGNDGLAEVDKNMMVLPIMFFSLIFYYFPQAVLSVMKILRNKKGENEVLMLQTYALMMLKAGNKVKTILVTLMERSNVYKAPLELAVKNYSKSPQDVLEELKDMVGHPRFNKVVVALQQALNNDKSLSINYLENNRRYDKELLKIRRKEKTQIKKIVGLMLLGVPLLAFAFGIGWPWFTFAMKVMSKSY